MNFEEQFEKAMEELVKNVVDQVIDLAKLAEAEEVILISKQGDKRVKSVLRGDMAKLWYEISLNGLRSYYREKIETGEDPGELLWDSQAIDEL